MYEQPFVLTYIGNSLFAIYLPSWAAMTGLGWVANPPFRREKRVTIADECFKDMAYERVSLTTDTDSPLRDAEGGGTVAGEPTAAATAAVLERTDDAEQDGAAGGGGAVLDGAVEGAAKEAGAGRSLYSHSATAKISLIVCPIWFLANWSYNQSLSMTSVTSSTIISTTSSLFSFIGSVWFTGEEFTYTKLGGTLRRSGGARRGRPRANRRPQFAEPTAAPPRPSQATSTRPTTHAGVMLCMAGTVFVAMDDEGNGGSDQQRQALGDLVCLFSAVMYSVYTVLIRVYIPDDTTVAMPLFFGYLGVLNSLLLLPVIFVLLATDRNVFSGLTWTVFGFISAGGLMNNVLSE